MLSILLLIHLIEPRLLPILVRLESRASKEAAEAQQQQ